MPARSAPSRHLGYGDPTVATPAAAQQPGPCSRDWPIVYVELNCVRSPPVEPASRGGGIEPRMRVDPSSRLGEVTSRVQQDVRNRVAHLARRTENVQMKTIGQHPAAQAKHASDRVRDTCSDRFHAGGEIAAARRFDDQMNVVALQRVVHHAEPRAVPNDAQASFELAYEANRAERRDAAPQLQRDVTGVSRGERLATSVRIERMRAALAPRPVASAAPGRRRAEDQRELADGARHGRDCVTAP